MKLRGAIAKKLAAKKCAKFQMIFKMLIMIMGYVREFFMEIVHRSEERGPKFC